MLIGQCTPTGSEKKVYYFILIIYILSCFQKVLKQSYFVVLYTSNKFVFIILFLCLISGNLNKNRNVFIKIT